MIEPKRNREVKGVELFKGRLDFICPLADRFVPILLGLLAKLIKFRSSNEWPTGQASRRWSLTRRSRVATVRRPDHGESHHAFPGEF